MKNAHAIYCWQGGRANASGNLTSDGRNLYSYQLRIGFTLDDGRLAVIDYTAPAGHFKSVTTSGHANAAKRVASVVVLPGDPRIGGAP